MKEQEEKINPCKFNQQQENFFIQVEGKTLSDKNRPPFESEAWKHSDQNVIEFPFRDVMSLTVRVTVISCLSIFTN